jgi:hypothetical protein
MRGFIWSVANERLYRDAMDTRSSPLSEVEEEADVRALAAAVAESDADPRVVSHEEARSWLLRLEAGVFDAPPPEPRKPPQPQK